MATGALAGYSRTLIATTGRLIDPTGVLADQTGTLIVTTDRLIVATSALAGERRALTTVSGRLMPESSGLTGWRRKRVAPSRNGTGEPGRARPPAGLGAGDGTFAPA